MGVAEIDEKEGAGKEQFRIQRVGFYNGNTGNIFSCNI